MPFKRIFTSFITILFVFAPFVAMYERQNIYDMWSLKNYKAPANISKLATDTTMTSKATKIFYVARPTVQDKQAFISFCESAEKTIVLGCYKRGSGIYVYNVKDERLNGVLEVTAAHEMLHAAYDRLNTAEKANINKLTDAVFKDLKDERITKNIESYRSRDPSVVPNELHSILATEVKTLTPELETYYKKYFTDRQKVVSLSTLYEAEFSKRTNQIEAYDLQLKSLKSEIDNYNVDLVNQAAIIDTESSRLQSLLKIENFAEYNSGIPGYKKLVNKYNSDIAKLKAKINAYNVIIGQRNLIVTEEQELFNAIDTRVPSAK